MDDKHALVRALDDKEVRLNCLLCAVTANTYMAGRLSDPITIAQEFYTWVTEGKLTPRPGVQFGTQAPAVVEHGYGSEPPPSTTGDLIEIGKAAPHRPRN